MAVERRQGHQGRANRGGGYNVTRYTFEPLEITSGKLLVIDQFMLGNRQFLSKISLAGEVEYDDIVESYGGQVLSVNPGNYDVVRVADEQLFFLCPIGQPRLSEEEKSTIFESESEFIAYERGRLARERVPSVFIDTRCVVFVDAEVLNSKEVLTHYSDLRGRGREKSARDYLRERGAAVRYGFSRVSDHLGVYEVDDGRIFALWPISCESS